MARGCMSPRTVVMSHRDGYVWVQGYWRQDRGGWTWIDGHYERERAGHVYVQGYWKLPITFKA